MPVQKTAKRRSKRRFRNERQAHSVLEVFVGNPRPPHHRQHHVFDHHWFKKGLKLTQKSGSSTPAKDRKSVLLEQLKNELKHDSQKWPLSFRRSHDQKHRKRTEKTWSQTKVIRLISFLVNPTATVNSILIILDITSFQFLISKQTKNSFFKT